MATRKRNEYLDDEESADEVADQSSSDNVQEKGRSDLAGRAAKRRRVTFREEEDIVSDLSDGEIDQHARDVTVQEIKEGINPLHIRASEIQDDAEDEDDISIRPISSTTPKSVAKAEKAARKSGVVYISRVPPFMKPHTLKHFLAPHASKGIGRVFLTPEDHASYLSRKKNGGNKKKSFTDGWVEFVSKTEAKAAAETLNGNIMGGKKRNYYHDDLWNMKYLSGFKWSHLTEQIATENAERDARMREEIRRTRQENREFLEDFERGKMLETIESKKKGTDKDDGKKRPPAREFKQSQARRAGDRADDANKADVKRTLSMIF